MKILFQGDSITDSGRRVSGGEGYEVHEMGMGYPSLVKCRLTCEHPGKFEFVNRAISGNRIVDLYGRWRCDALNLKPDVISILEGVNDTLHEWADNPNGVDPARAERIWREMIAWTRTELPDVKFILLEPFFLPNDTLSPLMFEEMPKRAAFVKAIADELGPDVCAFIPMQSILNEACQRAPVAHWSRDGVHLTPAAHQLVADAWLAAAKRLGIV